ncbi:MAG: DNA-deoxyinosine glycosylase [Anaerolineae bacterium]|nr:DNA-deoxyinosine glycosylase [Anaerolineae bacterium]
MILTSFPPIAFPDARVLILGSMPGQRSLALGQYYGHPQNDFWYVMGEVCGAGLDLPYADRTAKLAAAGIALWDVLQHCEREGSLDSDIVRATKVPNDLAALLPTCPLIRAIFFNGQEAESSFLKLVKPNLAPALLSGILLKRLPSTSPANRMARAEKLKAWRALEAFLPATERRLGIMRVLKEFS